MKKWLKTELLIALAVCGLAVNSAAASSADQQAKTAWEKLYANDNFHLLDNLTPATFYDFNKKEWLAGGVTSVYQYKHVSIDIGTVKSMEESSNLNPLAGINFHLGSFLNSYGNIKKVVDTMTS